MRLSVDWKRLGIAGAKASVDLACHNYPAALKSVIDAGSGTRLAYDRSPAVSPSETDIRSRA